MLSIGMLRIMAGAGLAALPLAFVAQAQERPAPVRFATIDGGRDHYCALDTTGGVWCWGRNDFGQLGNGTTSSSNVPVAVTGLSAGVRIIAAGEEHSCALDAAGQAWCWGRNLAGGLGDLTTNDSSVPVAVQMLGTGASDIDVGQSHSCALDRRGRALCWAAACSRCRRVVVRPARSMRSTRRGAGARTIGGMAPTRSASPRCRW